MVQEAHGCYSIYLGVSSSPSDKSYNPNELYKVEGKVVELLIDKKDQSLHILW